VNPTPAIVRQDGSMKGGVRRDFPPYARCRRLELTPIVVDTVANFVSPSSSPSLGVITSDSWVTVNILISNDAMHPKMMNLPIRMRRSILKSHLMLNCVTFSIAAKYYLSRSDVVIEIGTSLVDPRPLGSPGSKIGDVLI
jgi:hypothetical protein